MGDMAEPWRSMREHAKNRRDKGGWYSTRHKTEEEAHESAVFANECNYESDQHTLKQLEKLGLKPVRKGYSSFQINLNGRVGMYYNGKKGKKIIWNDSEKVKIPYGFNGLEEYLSKQGE